MLYLNVYYLSSSTKVDSRVKFAHLIVHRMFKCGFICMCIDFICVLTIWAFVRGWRLFETWCLLEHGLQNPWHLL